MHVERAFLAGQVGELESALMALLGRGRAVFSNVGLVQCIKEIVEFAGEGYDSELSALDLTRCILGINQDNDQVDPEMLARVTNPTGVDLAALKADFHDFALDWVAQGLFDYSDTVETLASSAQETWRSGWAPGTG
jgi:hypothetical protein